MMARYRELTQCKGNRRALIVRGRQWLETGHSLAQRIAQLKLPTLIIWGGRTASFHPIPPNDSTTTSPAARW